MSVKLVLRLTVESSLFFFLLLVHVEFIIVTVSFQILLQSQKSQSTGKCFGFLCWCQSFSHGCIWAHHHLLVNLDTPPTANMDTVPLAFQVESFRIILLSLLTCFLLESIDLLCSLCNIIPQG